MFVLFLGEVTDIDFSINSGTQFNDNFAMTCGGGVTIEYLRDVYGVKTSVDGTFVGNKCSDYGGALSVVFQGVSNVSNVAVVGTYMYNGAGNSGGAVYVAHQTTTNLDLLVDGTYTNNNAIDGGGALQLEFGDDVTYANLAYTADMLYNVVTEGAGGAVQTTFSGITSHCTRSYTGQYSHNQASLDGGAIYEEYPANEVDTVEHNLVTINSRSLSNNKAGHNGGALAMYSNFLNILDLEVQFLSNVFESNSADNNGGAVSLRFVTPINASIVKVQQSTFRGNLAGYGGALYVEYDSHQGSSTLSIENNLFHANSAKVGGAVFVDLGCDPNTGLPCPSSTSLMADISQTVFEYNTATLFGGAFHFLSLGNNSAVDAVKRLSLVFESCTFAYNRALESGGALSVSFSSLSESFICIADSNFTMNSAALSGGAVSLTTMFFNTYTWTNSSVLVTGTTFESNSAGVAGGALDFTSTNLVSPRMPIQFVSLTTHNNTAVQGGALNIRTNSMAHLQVNVSRCNFDSDAATIQGGCVFIHMDAAAVDVENSVFHHCRANSSATALVVLASGIGSSMVSLLSSQFFSLPGSLVSFLGDQVLVQSVSSCVDTGSNYLCSGGRVNHNFQNTSLVQSALKQSEDKYQSFIYTETTQLTSSVMLNIRCEVCPAGFYAVDDIRCFGVVDDLETCNRCPTGATCTGGVMVNSTDG